MYHSPVRYLLLDRITVLEPPTRACGVKAVALSDDVFADHFPGHPLMPGALQIEGMAQLGGVLLEQTLKARGVATDVCEYHALLIGVDRARFRRVVRPGDRLEFEATVRNCTEDGGRAQVTASVDGSLVSDAELTYAFSRVTNARAIARRRDVLNVWLYGDVEPP